MNATNNTQSNKTGLGILLKVMSGDKVNVFGNSYHKKPGAGYSNATNPLTVTDIINLFTATPAITDKGISTGQITGAAGFPVNINSLLSNPPAQSSSRPRAGINWIILDEQFKFVTGGFDVVGDAGSSTTGTFKAHSLIGLEVEKNGYFYAWCSNESQYNVFFDNLQLIHDRGAILEETHYYPFGLVMQGISSKAAGGKENKFKFGGKELQSNEFTDGAGLEMYDFGARNYDAQIGRWHTVDPLASAFPHMSPYAAFNNNPLRFTDPTGAAPDDFVKRKDGSIYWDNNANDQATTKAGETYLGKTLTFNFNSNIDKKLWDGPVPWIGPHPAGDKLTSTITVTGSENAAGELTGISATKSVVVGKTPWGSARDYFPGLGADQNKFTYSTSSNADGTLATYNLNFEQHASVSSFEQFGLNSMGYDIVNVAQNLQVNYSGGNLKVTAATDIFPSSTLTLNGTQLFHYNQPSFKATHAVQKTVVGFRPPLNKLDDGLYPIYEYKHLRPAPAFYQRYSK